MLIVGDHKKEDTASLNYSGTFMKAFIKKAREMEISEDAEGVDWRDVAAEKENGAKGVESEKKERKKDITEAVIPLNDDKKQELVNLGHLRMLV